MRLNVLSYFIIATILLANVCFAQTEKTDLGFSYVNQGDAFWKRNLSPEIYNICRLKGTEPPASGQYDKLYQKGTYYCACCGGDFALFQSNTKFDSGTGWPSFYAPIEDAVIERPDPDDNLRGILGLARTEVICSRCHSHLGHVFEDGPLPTGLRYCINSVILDFNEKN